MAGSSNGSVPQTVVRLRSRVAALSSAEAALGRNSEEFKRLKEECERCVIFRAISYIVGVLLMLVYLLLIAPRTSVGGFDIRFVLPAIIMLVVYVSVTAYMESSINSPWFGKWNFYYDWYRGHSSRRGRGGESSEVTSDAISKFVKGLYS